MHTSINKNSQNNIIPISNSIILNNYSIQNLIISPSIYDAYGKSSEYENSYFNQRASEKSSIEDLTNLPMLFECFSIV